MRSTNNVMRLVVGMALFTQFGLAQPAQAMGQIGYFEDRCPDGWEEYRALTGRVAVGAGNYIQDVGSRRESQRYRSGATGGEMQHKLTVQEMPGHSHRMFAAGNSLGKISPNTAVRFAESNPKNLHGCPASMVYALVGSTGKPSLGRSGSSGNNKLHNNMQPYLVLVACKKTVDELAAIRQRLNRLENPQQQEEE